MGAKDPWYCMIEMLVETENNLVMFDSVASLGTFAGLEWRGASLSPCSLG